MTEDGDLFTGAGGADPPQLPVEPLDPVLVAEVLDALTTRQHALERAFDALNRRVGAPTKEGPWTWRALGPTQTRVLFGELRDWVDWLTVRYDLRGESHAVRRAGIATPSPSKSSPPSWSPGAAPTCWTKPHPGTP